MLLLRTFDSVFAGLAELNSEGNSDGGWFWGAFALVGPLFILGLSLSPEIAAHGKTFSVALLGPIALAVSALYGRLRRTEIRNIRSSLPKPVPYRARLFFSGFLIVSTVATAWASARISPIAGISAFILVACLPWSRLAGVANAP